MLVQPLVQLLKVFGPMPGEVDGMQTIRRMDAGVARTQPSDTRPAVDINGRHDHVADAGVMGTFDDGVAIDIECLGIEMDMSVDQCMHEKCPFACDRFGE